MKKLLQGFITLIILFLSHGLCATPVYQSSDTIIVEGQIINHTIDSVRLGAQMAAVDEEGSFRFKIPLEEASYTELKAGDAEILLFVEPQKDIFISFEEGNVEETIRFEGRNAAINRFLFDQQVVSQSFNSYFNKNVNAYLYKLPEQEFVFKMDSLQTTFLDPLKNLVAVHPEVNKKFVKDYRAEIELSFLAFLADYPLLHQKNTGDTVRLSESSMERLAGIDLNDPALHQYEGLQGLLKNFLYLQTNQELKKNDYSKSDNKRLDAGFAVIKRTFTNQEVFDKVLYEFFLNHIENLGIKNIEDNLAFFNTHSRNAANKEKINTLYAEAQQKREGHIIRTYKEVDDYKLDAHIFMPDSMVEGKKYPAIAMFHGGSFYEGKPDWFFSTGERYASQGWVAVSVEYRVADRHDNLLPEAISDGKSLVRYLRTHADEIQIDTAKIMVTGNSSGATIALALATLDDTLDEPTENHSVSSRPNAIMVNAGLADLTGSGHHWWHKHYDADFVEAISPLHQLREGLPPMLIVHGTNDNAVDIESIRLFAEKSKALGNPVHYHELQGAPHVIWLIPHFSRQINKFRKGFMESLAW